MKNGLQPKQNQCKRILAHLQEHGNISQMQAVTIYGIGQPGARIFELRKQGHNIKSTFFNGINRYGEKTRYVIYTLEEEQGAQ